MKAKTLSAKYVNYTVTVYFSDRARHYRGTYARIRGLHDAAIKHGVAVSAIFEVQ